MTEIVDLIMDHRLCRECIAMKSQSEIERVAAVLAQLMRHFVISARATCEGCGNDTVVYGFSGPAKQAARSRRAV